jgi:hypothetical protein
MPESYSTTDTTSSLPIVDILTEGPIPVQVYQEDNGVRNSWLPQSSTVAIQQPTMDVSTASFPIDEEANHPATQRQALWGVDRFTELSMTSLSASSLYSARTYPPQYEEPSSPNFRPAIQANHNVNLTLPIASSPASDTLKTFWCRGCNIGFVQRQGLNRHKKDHGPRNTCPLCKTFKWSPARKYLFTKHLKRQHPEAVPT